MVLKIGQAVMQFLVAMFMIWMLSLILKILEFGTILSFFLVIFLIWVSIMWLLKELKIR